MSDNAIGEFWRIDRVMRECGIGKSFLYDHERQGKFPKRIKLGRASAWNSSEIMQWKRDILAGKTWVGGSHA